MSQIECRYSIVYSNYKIIEHFVFEVMIFILRSFLRVKICVNLLLYFSSPLVNFFLILLHIPFYDFQRYTFSLFQWVINPNVSDGTENVGLTITAVFISKEHEKCSFSTEE